ncbi:hypothetical protein [Aeromonas hydrophila]|nr:hypothetical protein [Aeromonas hydrophila]MDF5704455.1 hypothetical protein [Aeromonas hydrophila subsp. hydrophila]
MNEEAASREAAFLWPLSMDTALHKTGHILAIVLNKGAGQA